MTNELKKVPELRFPEFNGEWEKKRLGEVVNYKNGGSFESLVKNHGVYKLITLKSVNTEGKLINSEKYIDDKCVETLRNDTLVMILSEQAPGLVGMTAIIPNNNEYVLNQRVAALVPNQFIDSQFLSKLINRNQKYFSVRSAGTKVKNISKGHVESFNFLSPDYTEQQKIGEFFSKLDRQIELEEQKLVKLEEQKKGYMQQIFSQKLRFKDESGNEYPEWEEKKLFDFVKYLSSKRSSNYYSEDIIHGQYPVYDAVQEISRDTNFDIEESYISILKDGAGVGRLNLRPGKSSVIGTMGYLLPQNIDIKFLFYYLKTMNFNRFVIGSTIPHLYFKDYSKETILIPIDKSEQIKIGSFFIKLDSIINNKAKKIKVLKQRKQGLLQKMFV
ncbi:restriction endonuclease subunit S [Mammaliicoccus fleurettii]|uniref:restriction endonuclease subunit S n=1 Tax=Mammaliicoccus fleurettii TaxID=150056 RepID=UPI000D1C4980|nr:restriction endonuclease subunit S [Mammaliicoccus fleurettii]PTE32687.1 restriction endonuclease subunit S [Mammaliicoccus fleurettii]